MRTLLVKYEGACRKCGAELVIGQEARYEKYTGIFCVGHEPTDREEIRAYRQERADRKADRLEEWAEKREKVAERTLDTIRERYRGDFAFNTQPGHIPERARVIRAQDRAYESLGVAGHLRGRAAGLRHVVVKGDAEAKRQKYREFMDARLAKGSRVHDFCFGDGEIVKVNRLSYTIKFDGGFQYARDKSYVKPIGFGEPKKEGT